jgi:hypothetical protein
MTLACQQLDDFHSKKIAERLEEIFFEDDRFNKMLI